MTEQWPLPDPEFASANPELVASISDLRIRHEAKLAGAAQPVEAELPATRQLKVRKLSGVTRKAVRWLWKERVPVGSLVLLVGREGIGKSTVAYDLAASITRGKLPGDQYGKPRGVIIVATEDSLESTIAPRLDAAGADDELIYQVVAQTPDGMTEDLQLPVDIGALSDLVVEQDIALIILDPLTSRLSPGLDTHKDADVRKALEPLTRFTGATGVAVLGLMHVNKGGSGDPSTSIMGSRAFPAVARAVLFVQVDEDNEAEKCAILEVVKSNLGPKGKDNLLFEVQEVQTGFDGEENLPIMSSKVNWMGNTDRTVKDAMAASTDILNDQESVDGASMWLRDYLEQQGGEADSTDVKKDGSKAGYSESALKRARKKLGFGVTYRGFPRKSYWSLDLPGDATVSSDEYTESVQ